MAEESSWKLGQYAAEILAPEIKIIGPDTAGIGDSLTASIKRAATNPGLVVKAGAALTGALAAIPSTVLTDWIAAKKAKDSKPADRRFSDPAWTENPYFHAVLLAYLSGCDFARTLVSESGLQPSQAAKAELGLELMLGAAIDGARDILDIKPSELHQRTPLIIGSKRDVAYAHSVLSAR